MMYNQKLVVCVKHNGKILRENKDLVQLPFGSEFSVLIKNLNSRRVKFTLHIDGTDVLDGQEIIVNANSETEMKRFIRNGNMNEGNAFKFIERTAAIEDGPRGIKVDDGVVRVEFWFEQEKPVVTTTVHHHYDEWHNDWHYRYPYRRSFWLPPVEVYGNGPTCSSTTDSGIRTKGIGGSGMSSSISGTASANNISSNATQSMGSFSSPEVSETGITVPGSKVEQKFTTVYGFNAEAVSHVIVLRLAGKIGTVEVVAPVTVKNKPKCETCGKTNKATSKFCSACGTSLVLL